MITVIQRVLKAHIEIDGRIHVSSGRGLLILAGIKKGDTLRQIELMAKKIIDLRIFEDDKKKMNLSVKDVQGEILVISQFTLCTDNNKSGNRPSFTFAEEPVHAQEIYEKFLDYLKSFYFSERIKSGVFAADMKVNLVNDGPVTIILEK